MNFSTSFNSSLKSSFNTKYSDRMSFVVKEEGTMKLILAILISVFAGVVSAAFVNFILDFRKYQKESEAAKETFEE